MRTARHEQDLCDRCRDGTPTRVELGEELCERHAADCGLCLTTDGEPSIDCGLRFEELCRCACHVFERTSGAHPAQGGREPNRE